MTSINKKSNSEQNTVSDTPHVTPTDFNKDAMRASFILLSACLAAVVGQY